MGKKTTVRYGVRQTKKGAKVTQTKKGKGVASAIIKAVTGR